MESRQGYVFGTTTTAGTGRHAGRTLKVWFKNENHVPGRTMFPMYIRT